MDIMPNFNALFQSTLPRRERHCLLHCFHDFPKYFNPRSREGSDSTSSTLLPWLLNFNPRSREGSDKIRDIICKRIINFNPRSREGSDQSR